MFEFTSPQSLDDALQLWHDRARWYAGGVDLGAEIKTGLAMPARLINLKQIAELRGIAETADGVRIGTLTTLAEIAENKLIRDGTYRALAEACSESASPQIRNVGTLGGNLNQDSACEYYRGDFHCWLKGGATCFMRDGDNRHAAIMGYDECVHVHPSDPAVALVALDARIVVRGRNSAREIAAAEFFRRPTVDNRRLTLLNDDELITDIQLLIFQNSRSAYQKAMDRAAFTHAIVSAAVRLDLDGAQIAGARVVLGGVAPTPWREEHAEGILVGQKPTAELAARAAEMVVQNAQPLAHNTYKVRLAHTLVKRAVMAAAAG